jgi:hypothetical protein
MAEDIAQEIRNRDYKKKKLEMRKMDYQLWFYIMVLYVAITKSIDKDMPVIIRIILGMLAVFWLIRLVIYLIAKI